MTSIVRKCPSCKEIVKMHRSRTRNIFERTIHLFGLIGFYKCSNCGWRGIILKKKKFNFNTAGVLKTLLLLIVVYYIVTYILKNYTK